MISFSNPFELKGSWYKGNLHTHTTNSDGTLKPEEIAELYRMRGYDFICITDHETISNVEGLSRPDFIVIGGEEISIGKATLGEPYHLVAVNLKDSISDHGDDIQAMIEELRDKDSEVLLCHPYWSSLLLEDMLKIDGYIGIEIFNTSCFFSIAKGHATVHWDELLSVGRKVWGFATDDAHFHFNDHRPNDAFGAWIMVKSKFFSIEGIMESISKGLFFSSNGPTIKDMSVEEESIIVKTEHVRKINFVADGYRGESFTAPSGKTIDCAEYKVGGNEKYVRVECIDAEGKAAWSNPIFFKSEK
ncbi:MAG: CehA/McbA family metallohydrolase [Thermoproteota archaeon]